MSEQLPPPFEPYPSPLGPVVGHDGNSYIIAADDGRTIGIRAATTPSPANVEADITNPPPILATPAQIAEYRWKVENGGVSVPVSSGTYRFDSTRENRVSWVVLAGIAQSNPNLTQKWKTLEGVFVVLTALDILTVYQKILAHISACFAKEEELLGRKELPLLEKLEEEFKELL